MAGSRRGSARHCAKARVYDSDGQLVTASFMDYAMPRADDLPSYKVGMTPTRCPSNPLGIKGCGEAGAIAAPAAVINAITDAIGSEELAMPATRRPSGAPHRRRVPGRPHEFCRRRRGTEDYRAEMIHVCIHLSSAEDARGGGRSGEFGRGGEIAGRRPDPAADDEAAPCRAGSSHRSRPGSPICASSATTGSSVVIGALTPHFMVATSADVAKKIPALAALAGMIGDPAVRHRGTIGGSIANNDPAADYPAACLALGATITTNRRKIAAQDFFRGLFETALEDGEIITEVAFPVPDKAAYEKFRQPASRFALVGVFVAKFGNDVRVAVTGAGASGVFRATQLETALKADFSAEGDRGDSDAGRGAQQRHPRRCRLSRPSHRRHGAPRRRQGGVGELAPFSRSGKEARVTDHNRASARSGVLRSAHSPARRGEPAY